MTQIITRYRTAAAGRQYIVPNEMLVNNIVQNQTYSDSKVRVATAVGVAYWKDLDRVREVLVESPVPLGARRSFPALPFCASATAAWTWNLGFWTTIGRGHGQCPFGNQLRDLAGVPRKIDIPFRNVGSAAAAKK